MHTINLKSSQILIGENLLEKLSSILPIGNYTKIFVITDSSVAPHWLNAVKQGVKNNIAEVIVKPGENHKNIDTVQTIWQEMIDAKLDRKSVVVNLGGGVTGDMGGFAASTFMRGIDFIQIPTTLLAQVDASVGGKVGIDFAGGKNLIGTFNQPKFVVVDVDTLKTLPERELKAGFAEVVKHGLIADKNYLKSVTAKTFCNFDQNELIDIILGSCRIKTKVVEQDEKEGGIRKILNFGHTFGHAIESISLETATPLLHGEAVTLGMLVAAKLSEINNLINESALKEIEKSLIPLLPDKGLIPKFDYEAILDKMKNDKKNTSGQIKWVLLQSIGQAVFDQEVEKKKAKQAIKAIWKSLNSQN